MDNPATRFLCSVCLILLAICFNLEFAHFMNNLEAIDPQGACESPAYDGSPDTSIDSEGNDCSPSITWIVVVAKPSQLAVSDAATSNSSIPSAPLPPPPKFI